MKKLCCLTLLIICSLTQLPTAQIPDFEPWPHTIRGYEQRLVANYGCFSRAAAASAQTKWQQIEAELSAAEKSEWVGDYTFGSEGDGTHETIVRWAINTGFVMLGIHSCYPMVNELSWGRVLSLPDRITFSAAPNINPLANHHNSTQAHCGHSPTRLAKPFVPVKWGEAHYLVPTEQLAIFCDDYVAGLGRHDKGNDPQFAFPLIKREEQGKRLEQGLPILPAKYAHLVKRPIDAQIIQIVRTAQRPETGESLAELEVMVRLNVGAAAGVRRGMFLNDLSLERHYSFEVVKVARNFSLAVTTRSGDEIKEWPPIKPGIRLSTSSFPH